MKKYVLFVIAILFCQLVKAQDTIVKINKQLLIGKIIEITATEIKYKKANFLDGPTYVENKSEIQSIRFSNGQREDFAPAQTATAAPTTAITLPITESPATTPVNNNIVKSPDKVETDDYYQQPEKSQSTTTQPAVQKQENKTSDKPFTDDYYSQPTNSSKGKTGQLSISKKVFKQNDQVITEKEFHNILKQTNDKEIMALVEKAGRAKKRQYIGFDCIMGGSIFLLYPPAFLLLEPIPIIMYFTSRSTRRSCNKKAAELYNKK